MQASMTSTDQTLELDGHRVRLWRGVSAAGIPFLAFIPRVAVEKSEDAAEFERELTEIAPLEVITIAPPLSPRELLGLMGQAGIDLRMVT